MKSTDFVQASVLARASEGQLSHNDRVSKAADCASVDALCAFVRSLFPQDAMPQDGLTLDALCDAYLSAAVKLVRSFSPVPALFDSLLYKYDAANLKLCIKARITDAPRPALFPFGTVGADEAYSAAEKNSFEAFPEGIRAGAEKALADYASTGEARAIDLALDAGCFEDTAKSAAASGVPLLSKLCGVRADSANVTAYLRIAKTALSDSAKRALFDRAFVSGGTLTCEKFESGEFSTDALASSLYGTELSALLRSADAGTDAVREVEAYFDSKSEELLSAIKFVAFGPEVLCAFIVEHESDVRAFMTAGAYLRRGAAQNEIRGAVLGKRR